MGKPMEKNREKRRESRNRITAIWPTITYYDRACSFISVCRFVVATAKTTGSCHRSCCRSVRSAISYCEGESCYSWTATCSFVLANKDFHWFHSSVVQYCRSESSLAFLLSFRKYSFAHSKVCKAAIKQF